MKYTRSVDGVMRVTVHASMRLTKESFAEYRQLAKANGFASFGKFLNHCLKDGLMSAERASAGVELENPNLD